MCVSVCVCVWEEVSGIGDIIQDQDSDDVCTLPLTHSLHPRWWYLLKSHSSMPNFLGTFSSMDN